MGIHKIESKLERGMSNKMPQVRHNIGYRIFVIYLPIWSIQIWYWINDSKLEDNVKVILKRKGKVPIEGLKRNEKKNFYSFHSKPVGPISDICIHSMNTIQQ